MTYLERHFMQALVDRLRDQRTLEWQSSPGRTIWVNLSLGGQSYWVSAKPFGVADPLLAGVVTVGAVSLLIVFLGLLMSRQIASPLRALTVAADRLALGQVGEAVPVQGPREVRALSASFAKMMERLEESQRSRALVLAGVSHDVRTPLAKLRLAVEMMPDQSDLRETAIRQVTQIDRLLQQFLDHARGFDAEPLRAFDPSAVARSAAADVAGALNLIAPDTDFVLGRPESLRRALVNLLENAFTHGAPPVSLTVETTSSELAFAIRDGGPGPAEDQIPRLRQPFERGEGAAVPGSGLGLAIVERVAVLHGARLDLRRLPGGGFEVRLAIPIARPKEFGNPDAPHC
jgi:two-component system osmolarity sensor histidine kinase EnvZ